LKNRNGVTTIIVMCCFAVLATFAGITQADDGECNGEHFDKNQQHNFQKIAKKLGLSDVQRGKAKAIFQKNKDVVKPTIASLRAEQITLRSLIHADTIDVAAIRAETAKISGIQADLNVDRANVVAQFRAILTPAQLAILKTLHKKGHHKGEVITTPGE
jgi:periplasmic protein CpxP/Spy